MPDLIPEQFKLCLTSVNDECTAKHIARTLLQQKLVACVNISNKVTSLYHWQSEIVEESEFLISMKTTVDKLDCLRETLIDLHPYDVPELIVLAVESGDANYLDWIHSILS